MKLLEFANLAIGVPFLDHGRDFFGWDCWGLILRVYREVYGVELESFDYQSAMNNQEAGELFTKHAASWNQIQASQEAPGDVILLRQGSWPCHAGIVVRPGYMLHTDAKCDTCIESYYAGAWKHRIIGFYRHAELASHT